MFNCNHGDSSYSLSYSFTTKSLSFPLKTSGCLSFICWLREPSDLIYHTRTRSSLCSLQSGTCSGGRCPLPIDAPYASFRRLAHCYLLIALLPSSASKQGYLKFLQFDD